MIAIIILILLDTDVAVPDNDIAVVFIYPRMQKDWGINRNGLEGIKRCNAFFEWYWFILSLVRIQSSSIEGVGWVDQK